ncbi:hypothetical protein [Novosphingobium sp. UBA1939]|uniref:hypothetical protein n=1 Tax=Novosphingobium sp. UBA1939 TaxID=1946982 RepID=UPI0025E3B146|nr:hypothetical protein [Novosphingobium sp. UBA1939]
MRVTNIFSIVSEYKNKKAASFETAFTTLQRLSSDCIFPQDERQHKIVQSDAHAVQIRKRPGAVLAPW